MKTRDELIKQARDMHLSTAVDSLDDKRLGQCIYLHQLRQLFGYVDFYNKDNIDHGVKLLKHLAEIDDG